MLHLHKKGFPALSTASTVLWGILAISSFWTEPFQESHTGPDKPRVLILTDITSLQAGTGEPDDGQSLIRLMLYTNELQIDGLIASSNLGHGQRVQPDLIRRVIETYGKVQPTLLQHDRSYPPAARLLGLVKSGQPLAGPNVPVTTSVGAGLDTEASDWLIRVVDRPDPRPVWVCAWGGTADLAQALWKVQQTRSEEAVKAFIGKLRIHAIADQDATGPWIRQQFPTLFYILNRHNFRGMYRGGNTRLADSGWVATHIQQSGSLLGALYPNYAGGDIWSSRIGRVKGIKEGDSPSFLSLIPNGLNRPEQPELGGWGGLFKKSDEGYYQDQIDSTAGYATDPTPYMASVYRWRPAWQADFQARLQWCTRTYRQANHHPLVRIDGDAALQPLTRVVSPGSDVQFDAGNSTDPDGQSLRFNWQIYPGSLPKGFVLTGDQTPRLRCRIAKGVQNQSISLLLTVTDTGQPALSRYRRIVLHVR
ncbi:nucleoside hydrolase-like domain-containing protein [Larkinella punicea]|uniref:DUF1593 domain-containing protein n=1 Tax=Larkinella punicea TaxID=2315727 RepID=A0A368JCS1_9BACT|nr:nucleoside hydrolase-like domain-containing protein [Larkinella punicea]RCR65467.1 DUF1593 domain-containing protein [Larkinella punicea]